MSIVITVVNAAFRFLITYMTKFEENQTDTIINFSIGIKLTFLRFINSSIIPILIYINVEDWFT